MILSQSPQILAQQVPPPEPPPPIVPVQVYSTSTPAVIVQNPKKFDFSQYVENRIVKK